MCIFLTRCILYQKVDIVFNASLIKPRSVARKENISCQQPFHLQKSQAKYFQKLVCDIWFCCICYREHI
jgi:hypothetical protein